ncbi:G protein-activated inward rectifier potassium channel 4-like [Tachypleus tridentatus]|uniref:G protein-activated inward rectifier potassium channel 4-like n=1 Tax=Tachypleus tridentatus TaxID=6853 RepID=UPI003FD19F2B
MDVKQDSFLQDMGIQEQKRSENEINDFASIETHEGFTKHLFLLDVFNKSRQVSRYRETKVIPSYHRRRLVLKNGTTNVTIKHISKRRQRYLQDLFITLVDIQWRWNLLVFAMGFITTWLGFGIIWWLITFSHGDFEHMNDKNWEPCVHNIKSFTSAFLFSLETQHTIGYGYRYINEECPEAIFVLCMQSIIGVLIQCFIVGMIFAKFSRPKKRQQTLMFSRNAIICLHDGKLCLMFRVGNMRKSTVIDPQVSLHLLKRKITAEDEIMPYYHSVLEVQHQSAKNSTLLSWPVVVVHEVNENSPLYTMSAEDLLKDTFEIIAILEGTSQSTGQFFQAKISYLPNEILWGHQFEQLLTYTRDTSEFLVDFGKLNNTYEVETPLCSAKHLYEFQSSYSLDHGNYNLEEEKLKKMASVRKFMANRSTCSI